MIYQFNYDLDTCDIDDNNYRFSNNLFTPEKNPENICSKAF